MSLARRWLHRWNKWAAFVAFAVSLVAVYQASQSLREARAANDLTKIALAKGERPWFAVTGLAVEPTDSKRYRLAATIRHFAGGPALNISFATAINAVSSPYSGGAAALLPADSLQVRSYETGPRPQQNDTITWRFRFNDATGREFSLEQSMQMRSLGVKQLTYTAGGQQNLDEPPRLPDSKVATLLSLIGGAAITWFFAWLYYKRAGDDLRRESSDLRHLTTLMLRAMEDKGLAGLNRDSEGRIVGLRFNAEVNEGLFAIDGAAADLSVRRRDEPPD